MVIFINGYLKNGSYRGTIILLDQHSIYNITSLDAVHSHLLDALKPLKVVKEGFVHF